MAEQPRPARELVAIQLERIRAQRAQLLRDLDMANGRYLRMDSQLAARENTLGELLEQLKGEEQGEGSHGPP